MDTSFLGGFIVTEPSDCAIFINSVIAGTIVEALEADGGTFSCDIFDDNAQDRDMDESQE